MTERPTGALRVLDAVAWLLGGGVDGPPATRLPRFLNGIHALLAMAIVLAVRGVTPQRVRIVNRIIRIVERAGRSRIDPTGAKMFHRPCLVLDYWADPDHPGRNRLVRRILRRRGLLRTARERAVVRTFRTSELLDLLHRTEGILHSELALAFQDEPDGS